MSKIFHLFTPGADPVCAPLLLLHGTGGTELDLLPLARDLSSETSTLSVRGTVAIEGGFAFFHRHPDRTVDEAERASILANFLETCRAHHGFAAPIAVGFSNSAIMAAALLLTRPSLLSGAILFRPLPLSKDLPTRMHATPVLIIDGQNDTRRSRRWSQASRETDTCRRCSDASRTSRGTRDHVGGQTDRTRVVCQDGPDIGVVCRPCRKRAVTPNGSNALAVVADRGLPATVKSAS